MDRGAGEVGRARAVPCCASAETAAAAARWSCVGIITRWGWRGRERQRPGAGMSGERRSWDVGGLRFVALGGRKGPFGCARAGWVLGVLRELRTPGESGRGRVHGLMPAADGAGRGEHGGGCRSSAWGGVRGRGLAAAAAAAAAWVEGACARRGAGAAGTGAFALPAFLHTPGIGCLSCGGGVTALAHQLPLTLAGGLGLGAETPAFGRWLLVAALWITALRPGLQWRWWWARKGSGSGWLPAEAAAKGGGVGV